MPSSSTMSLSELKIMLRSLQLPADTKLSITFEDGQDHAVTLKKQTAVSAMNKLKGSGNGYLVAALLTERQHGKMK